MGDNGEMLRTPELMKLAQKWSMPFITIKDLQDYIRAKNVA